MSMFNCIVSFDTHLNEKFSVDETIRRTCMEVVKKSIADAETITHVKYTPIIRCTSADIHTYCPLWYCWVDCCCCVKYGVIYCLNKNTKYNDVQRPVEAYQLQIRHNGFHIIKI